MSQEIIITIIGTCGMILAKDGIWEFLKNRKVSPQDKLLLAMARRELIYLSKKYIRQKYIPSDEYDMFIEMGESYLSMGGNHYGEKKFNEAKELPVMDEE